jgi:hypothetical protein
VFAKKGLIKNIGTSRLQGVWASTAALATGETKSTNDQTRGKPTKTSKATVTVPQEGTKARILFDEIDHHGNEGIPNAALVDFAVKDKAITPKKTTREVVAGRVSSMLLLLIKAGLVERFGPRLEASLRSTTTATTSTAGPPVETADVNIPPARSLKGGSLPVRPEKLSDQRVLRQSFLNELLHGKKRGMTVDQIVPAVKKADHSGFVTAGRDDDEIRREVDQFLRMSRSNYARNKSTPERWWIKEEAPDPFANGRK